MPMIQKRLQNGKSQEYHFDIILSAFKSKESESLDLIANKKSEREKIWTATFEAKLLQHLNATIAPANRLIFRSITILWLLFALVLDFLFLPTIFAIVALIALNVIIQVISTPLKGLALSRYKSKIDMIEMEISTLSAKLEQLRHQFQIDWNQACESYSGRPPDWKERREIVLARDGRKCQKCGYPDGFFQRDRELHVHHIIHISEGGNNSLNNLITLCHVCHGRIDRNHSGVRKLS
jgi:hypothetical protein